ncbi:MAG TPA: CcmD family protein [Terriglobia bacterium]|nr:CcmD family protein [Terriglobia bacterium]
MMPSLEVALKSIVAAYSVIFAGVFVFVWLMFGRQKNLEKRLEQLRDDVRQTQSKP